MVLFGSNYVCVLVTELETLKNYGIDSKNKFENQYYLATRYMLLNAITLTWNNIFHIRLYAI